MRRWSSARWRREPPGTGCSATVRSYVLQSRADAADLGPLRHRLADALIDAVGPARAGVATVGDSDGHRARERAGGGRRPARSDDSVARSLAWSIAQYHDITSSYRSGIAEIARCVDQRSGARPGAGGSAVDAGRPPSPPRRGRTRRHAIVERAAALAEEAGATGLGRHRGGTHEGELALRPQGPRPRRSARGGGAGDRAGDTAGRGSHLEPDGDRSLHARRPGEACRRRSTPASRAEEAAGLESFLATTHGNYAEALLSLGDPAGGARHQLEALELARSLGQATLVAFSHMVAARFALEDGDAADAVRLQAAADAILAREGYQLYAADEDQRTSLLESAKSRTGRRRLRRALQRQAHRASRNTSPT